jgi:DNA-binding Xre family transcriptional regulator
MYNYAEVDYMKTVSYNKLWKLLIDKGISKQQLRQMCEMSSGTLTKLNKGYEVSMSVLVKICKALDCDLGDICEVISEN